MEFACLLIVSLIAEPLKIIHGPPAFPVKNDSRLRIHIRSDDFIQPFQGISHLLHFAEYSRMLMSHMVDDSSMEFFLGSPSLSPLEILNGIRAMGNRLQGRKQMHAGTF